jgi:hypothetical protein
MPMQLRELYMCANGQEDHWSFQNSDNGAAHKHPLAFILGCIVPVLLLPSSSSSSSLLAAPAI